MTPNESHAYADELAELMNQWFLGQPIRINTQEYMRGYISEIIARMTNETVPHEIKDWTFDFSYTHRIKRHRTDRRLDSTELRGVMRIISDNNAEYKYEVTDDFVERYFGWATLKS